MECSERLIFLDKLLCIFFINFIVGLTFYWRIVKRRRAVHTALYECVTIIIITIIGVFREKVIYTILFSKQQNISGQ